MSENKFGLRDVEIEVLRLMSLGYNNAEIAAKTNYSTGYVNSGLTENIYRKMGLFGKGSQCVRAAAVATALRCGVIE